MSKKRSEPLVQGSIKSFNISPRGSYEGVLLETEEGIVQVNFAPEWGAVNRMQVGQTVSLPAEEEEDDRPRDHPVYRLIEADNDLRQEYGPVRVKGIVERLNYAKHGEPNGAVLDSGDFVHMKPHGAKDVGLALGQKLIVEGDAKPMVEGHRVIEAHKVNGIGIKHPDKPKKHATKKHAPKKHPPRH